MTRRKKCALLSVGAVSLISLGLVGCPFYGPRDLEQYPAAGTSPYVLPFAEGFRTWCVQGNNGMVSHKGGREFAYDFTCSVGTPVHASRGGVVSAVRDDSDRIATGDAKDNNYVRVRHADGTEGSYLHIEHEGALVKVGQQVRQGDVLARASWTGRAAMPHVHFHVRKGGKQIPVSFRDVQRHRGVPRSLRFYVAGGPSD